MTDMRTIAVVDLGSNSFHLLIARLEEDRIYIQDGIKEPVRLALGLRPDGSLSKEAQHRALACLARFEQRLRGIPQASIRVVGTNTLRRTKNPFAFLSQIEETLKAPVEIISGREEARLIHLGVSHHLPPSQKKYLLVDIGGGSTELIVGTRDQIENMESIKMGCVTFSMRFFPDNLITWERWHDGMKIMGRKLEPYITAFNAEHWESSLGCAGSIKAISRIHSAMGFSDGQITKAGLRGIRDWLLKNKSCRPDQLPGLKEDRVPVFLGGFLVLSGLFKYLEIKQMSVMQYGMRDGVLYDLIGREADHDKREETVEHFMKFYGADKAQADRVTETALELYKQVMPHVLHRPTMAKQGLNWAAKLHEIGLAIAHSAYHHHGGYILLNADMDGFSKIEQGLIGFLVLNHRKRLKTIALPYENIHDWALVLVLRLSFILHRDRISKQLPPMEINFKGRRRIQVRIPQEWIQDHPLTEFDLQIEPEYWKKIDIRLTINE